MKSILAVVADGGAGPVLTTALTVARRFDSHIVGLHAVTTGARTVMGLPAAGVEPGAVADLVLVPDVDLGDILAGTEDARVVLHGGRVVADTRVRRSVDL